MYSVMSNCCISVTYLAVTHAAEDKMQIVMFTNSNYSVILQITSSMSTEILKICPYIVSDIV